MPSEDPTDNSTAQQHEDSAKRPFNPDGGEDEGGASHDGDESHLDDDQKADAARSREFDADAVSDDDPRKTEKLTKAGRELDPNDGAD